MLYQNSMLLLSALGLVRERSEPVFPSLKKGYGITLTDQDKPLKAVINLTLRSVFVSMVA